MRMRELKSLGFPPGGSIEAKPGGRHVMLRRSAASPCRGGEIQGVLQFEHAGRVEVEFNYRDGGPTTGPSRRLSAYPFYWRARLL